MVEDAAAAAWVALLASARALLESSCFTVRLVDGRRGAEIFPGAWPASSAAPRFPPPPPPAAAEALVGGRLGGEKDPCVVLDLGSRPS